MVKEQQPVSFRPTKQDVEAMKAIRAAYKWINSDADTIRAALAMTLDVLLEVRAVDAEAIKRIARLKGK